ncbi:MAG: hypothetical protein K2Q45_03285 [Nitrosomonas sp.]|nr:hypothetical protein [Nitrosomonas sp.]
MQGSPFQILREVKKKDEDARLVADGDDLYLETTASYNPIDATPATAVAAGGETTSMMEEAAIAPVPDMIVQSTFYMFLLHNLVLLCVFVLSLPLYYASPTRHSAVIWLAVSLVLFSIFYCNMLIWRKHYHVRLSIGLLCCWIVCFALSIGSIAVMLQNTAPILLVSMVWAETVAVLIHCKLSPRAIVAFPKAFLYMCSSTFFVWAICIALFVVEHDWPSAVVILIIAVLCCAYHAWQIKKMEHYCYNSSAEDVMLSIVQFYKVWPN